MLKLYQIDHFTRPFKTHHIVHIASYISYQELIQIHNHNQAKSHG
ncbi:hypothetical protein F383_27850 [Gossypium arboreum]|uniref:Uncharacterized protein n=1 Tax=Gossypium arboreum TaxID=29729 RepID=A0A0B0PAY0_GOSAR|nr:hypothetical protein F383_27850 [Gossypium arboreum]